MATKVGLEPTTFRLEVCCATIAPLGLLHIIFGYSKILLLFLFDSLISHFNQKQQIDRQIYQFYLLFGQTKLENFQLQYDVYFQQLKIIQMGKIQKIGNQGGTRTHNLQIRSLLRYHCATRLFPTNYSICKNTLLTFYLFYQKGKRFYN
ncbi:transmembrane protein, putative (macronuclear) [Tetrahymena thermophila SB210]|uniref:Transmembrane protein, putative n=1 Tax=Tetrahymena thermophila (strain SB210) TaxID=312017 RepID=I7LUV9_TETTS|nr:transmembrane protein, putative [Tetrahymena thermophila SB210]EAR96144.1 transmembrane protein, putative [Tetrahymena thermophila SB210]|eukprot:XP_001016389.1 transmembrane protein, putative [Tetrahymena thermophila SB210]